MTPNVPQNVRPDTGEEPDFRRAPQIDSHDRRSSDQAESLIRQLEQTRDSHGDATQKSIEGR